MRIKKNKFNKPIVQPAIQDIFYYDLVTLVVTFFLLLLSNAGERSIQFNIVVTGAFLAKSLVGYSIRKFKSFRKLRRYFVMRLSCDAFLILPVCLYYKFTSATSTNNFGIVIAMVILTELFALMRNFRNLISKSKIEVMETIEECQKVDFISHFNTKSKSIVCHINSFEAAKYLIENQSMQFDPNIVP